MSFVSKPLLLVFATLLVGCNQTFTVEVHRLDAGGQSEDRLAEHRLEYLRNQVIPSVAQMNQDVFELRQLYRIDHHDPKQIEATTTKQTAESLGNAAGAAATKANEAAAKAENLKQQSATAKKAADDAKQAADAATEVADAAKKAAEDAKQKADAAQQAAAVAEQKTADAARKAAADDATDAEKAEAKQAAGNAETLKQQFATATKAANAAKQKADAATKVADAAKKNLATTAEAAAVAKQNLATATTTADAAKKDLAEATKAADAAKQAAAEAKRVAEAPANALETISHAKGADGLKDRLTQGTVLLHCLQAYVDGEAMLYEYRGIVGPSKNSSTNQASELESGETNSCQARPNSQNRCEAPSQQKGSAKTTGAIEGQVQAQSLAATTAWIGAARAYYQGVVADTQAMSQYEIPKDADADDPARKVVAVSAQTLGRLRASGPVLQKPRTGLGFGGFLSHDIYAITPSDPNYERVLKAEPKDKPFTKVFGRASGDSTMIFVQESPSQMRFFSLDLDGDQLTRNILMVTDKALEAAVKYAAPVP